MKYRVKFRLVQVDGLFTAPNEGNMVRVVDEVTFDGGWLVLKWEVPGVRTRQVLAYPAANIAEGVEIDGVPDDYVERDGVKLDSCGCPSGVYPARFIGDTSGMAVLCGNCGARIGTQAHEREVAGEAAGWQGTLYTVGTAMWTTLGDTGVEILHTEGHNIGIRWRRTNKWTISAGGPVHAALIGLVGTAAQGSTQPGADKMSALVRTWPQLADDINKVISALGGGQ